MVMVLNGGWWCPGQSVLLHESLSGKVFQLRPEIMASFGDVTLAKDRLSSTNK